MIEKVVLKLVAEYDLEGKEVLMITPPATRFFWDHGFITYLCGKCKIILAENVQYHPRGNKVLKCNKCGSYSAAPSEKPKNKTSNAF